MGLNRNEIPFDQTENPELIKHSKKFAQILENARQSCLSNEYSLTANKRCNWKTKDENSRIKIKEKISDFRKEIKKGRGM